MFSSIQKMVHRIRTTFGDSDRTYGGDNIGNWSNYPQGVLQGNASGPAVWTTLSSVVFKILHERGFESNIISAISKNLFILVGFAYVNDCDLIQIGNNPVKVLASMQERINSWGDLVEVTGGTIRIDKSWWYLFNYVWQKGKWVCNDPHLDLDLVTKNLDGKLVSLNRLRSNVAAEMLGIWLAPDGNKNKIITHLKIEALDWAGKLRLSNLSDKESWLALYTNISAKLQYPLPALTLTKSECKGIMYPAIRVALLRTGITTKIASDIRDGPLDSGGAGVLSLYHYMVT